MLNGSLGRAGYFLRRAAELPPRAVLRKAVRRISITTRSSFGRLRDRFCSTYAPQTLEGSLCHLLDVIAAQLPEASRAVLQCLSSQYLAHRFDLLGSGWVDFGLAAGRADPHGEWLQGRVAPASLGEARRIWRLIEGPYQPIDWQADIKSGYRWSATVHSSSIAAYGNRLGVDIKMPWELARCQHLPQLALAYLARPDPALPLEFRNQLLDFVAQNPPRFGVNWVCAMDVAIRIANWIMTRDLFCGAGLIKFDAPFEEVMLRTTYEHARHVATNLEWSEVRGNHYLADVCGLLFAAAALPASDETDLWLAFAIQELIEETRKQFHEDGSNFEASTVYHRLSSEMVVYATAVALGLPKERVERLVMTRPTALGHGAEYRGLRDLVTPSGDSVLLPDWFAHRIDAMAAFTRDLTGADGRVIQFGDNDSGRFFKLPGAYELMSAAQIRQRYAQFEDSRPADESVVYPDEDSLDHAELLNARRGLFGHNECFNSAVVSSLAKGRSLPTPRARAASRQHRVGTDSDMANAKAALFRLAQGHRQSYRFALPASKIAATAYAYPGFGLYAWRGDGWCAWLKCGSVGQGGIGGHAHNDALVLELEVGGIALARDPGTYLYTPSPDARNRYRSATAHFVPRVSGREPASLENGLFVLPEVAGLACEYFGSLGFVGVHYGYGEKVMRMVLIERDAISVEDGSWGEPLERCILPSPLPISPKYGALLR